MNYNGAKKYLSAVARDVEFVDEAIRKGAYLTFEEWYDFLYKSFVACFKSKSIAKFEAVNKKVVGMARIESHILGEIANIQINGFTEFTSECIVRGVISRMNKVLGFSNRFFFYRSDEDGVVTFATDTRHFEDTVETEIASRDDLCCFLVDLWEMFVSQMNLNDENLTEFLKNHLCEEIRNIQYDREVKPYFGGVKTNTLRYVLSEKTEYEVSTSLPFIVNNRETPVATS